jgi:hypothetical protein
LPFLNGALSGSIFTLSLTSTLELDLWVWYNERGEILEALNIQNFQILRDLRLVFILTKCYQAWISKIQDKTFSIQVNQMVSYGSPPKQQQRRRKILQIAKKIHI